MRRYRVFNYDFDSRALILGQEKDWTPEIRKQWQSNIRKIETGLLAEFGSHDFSIKKGNFVDLGPAPFSIVAFHNKFLWQVKYAFVIGSYYPALTGACCLGERILNHLVLHLKEDFKGTPEYKKVYRKRSFDNWEIAIDTLKAWEILLPDVAEWFHELKALRHRSIHFRPDTDKDDRELAFSAIKKLFQIIDGQFSAPPFTGRPAPWFIQGIPGESYIKRSWEEKPFIKRIYLPNCRSVGFRHKLVKLLPETVIDDDFSYGTKEISDSEYVDLRNKHGLGKESSKEDPIGS